MPKLVVTDQQRTYLVDLRPGESVLVGRSSACDLRIHAPRASRRHCRIAPSGTGHEIRDLDSTNGTLLNAAPFHEAALLGRGDVIDAAGCRIVYWPEP